MPNDRLVSIAAQLSLRSAIASSKRRLRSRLFETLEPRQLLSVSVDANGFTQPSPSSDSRLIYVSSSTGSDTNTGLSPDAPVATIAQAYSLLRDSEPDWLLFKRGDTFQGSFDYFNDSGRSAQEPLVLTYYGDNTQPLPIIDSTSNTAFRTGPAIHDVYLLGLDFTSSTYNPSSPTYNGDGGYGFYDLGGSSDLFIEDCTFSYYINDLTFQGYYGPLSDITLYGNQILDSYNVAGHSQGLYAESTTNLTIENNFFDHDGWNESVPGAGSTIYNHDAYLHSSDANCVVTGNTFADASSFGLEARAGGIVDNNLFVNDPYGFAFGLVNGSTTKAGGVSGEVVGNVIIQPRKDGNGWGIGALIGNLKPGGNTVISDNTFASAPGDTAEAIELAPGWAVSNPQDEAGLHSVLINDNTVYNWGFGIYISPSFSSTATGADSISDVTISDNNFQDLLTNRIVSHGNTYDPSAEGWSGNVYSNPSFDTSQWYTLGGVRTSLDQWQATIEPDAVSQALAFIDPTRTIDGYMTSLGLSGGLPAYIAEARTVNDDNWNPVYQASAVINYIQGGLQIVGATPVGGTKAVNSTPTTSTTSPGARMLGPAQPVANWWTPSTSTAASSSTPTTGSGSSTNTGSASGGSTNAITPTTNGNGSTVSAPSTPLTVSTPSVPVLIAPLAPVDVPPTLAKMSVKYANPKHTAVSSITLVFSKPVVSTSGMVSLVNAAADGTTSTISTFVDNPSGDGKAWTVTWFGQNGNSLAAGSYTLTVYALAITDESGVQPAADIINTFEVAEPRVKRNNALRASDRHD